MSPLPHQPDNPNDPEEPGDLKAAICRQQRRREQRQIARLHHSDRGGYTDRFRQLIRELDQRYASTCSAESARAAGPVVPVTVVVTATGTASLKHRVRRTLRKDERVLRSHLPRRVPGSRRYIDL